MPEYLVLVQPSANRVYTESAPRLLAAELAILQPTLTDIAPVQVAGVDYVGFTAEDLDVEMLSNASSLFAVFERTGDLLRPVAKSTVDTVDDDLLTIQKYQGKTNELFTKLLVNLACTALPDPTAMLHRRLRLLDPLCGRGTTLNQAMMYGFDAAGVDVDGKDFDAYERFIKTWLRTKRFKHTAESGRLRQNKHQLGRRLDIEYAPTKEAFKAGEARTIAVRQTDTLRTDEVFKPNEFDLIVADAPYGVQHGSHQPDALRRSPRDLLAAALPVWLRVLKPGGSLALSFNTRTMPAAELRELLVHNGLTVHSGGPYEELEHRVDQAIVRDAVVATKA